ncbi:hypothetical protein CKO15_09840 [Halorhodospira abdelmalekii]|uniref:PD-(D/E)XK nuclease-like domain-containing protein n=1 Tax=Halorhodospira abdelmalekii TaxID=421629 RepID=UPI0019056EED|nr:PD-(D/E)XK nuclease-like domain-containing protein [Halorhodospira abdelmalekii]MBK1735579.1 hypothetical protein [Halorhodospira abdelmalekii]
MIPYFANAFNSTAPQAGIYSSMPNAVYHGAEGISSSQVRDLLRSPLHCWSRHLDPQRQETSPTPAMQLGTAVHSAVLEPGKWEQEYIVAPKVDRRTKAGKEAWATFQEEAGSRTVLTAEQCDRALAIAGAVRGHSAARKLLAEEGAAEISVFDFDRTHDLLLKVRPDWWSERALVDLKTTTDASPEGFRRKILALQYHVQAAFYIDLIEVATGDYHPWYWIAVETEAPYAVAVYHADHALIDEGRKLYKQALALYAECQTRDYWPGYSETVMRMALPDWWSRTQRATDEEIIEEVEF